MGPWHRTQRSLAALAALCALLGITAHGFAALKSRELLSKHPLEAIRPDSIRESWSDAVTVRVSPKDPLPASGSYVEVSWSGFAEPNDDDFMAVYVEGYSMQETSPVKYRKLSQASPEHVRSGSGSAEVQLLNLRAPLRIVLFTGGFDRPVAVAQSGPIQFATYNEPTGVHLMLAHGGDVLVQWTTRDSARPLVQFARSDSHGQSDAAPSEAAASNASYVAEDMCGGAAAGRGWIHPGQLHTARMAGLEPGMRYRFRVGDPDLPDAPWSAWREFLAPPATGPDAHVHMVAFADVGTDEADGSNQVPGWDHYFHGALNVASAIRDAFPGASYAPLGQEPSEVVAYGRKGGLQGAMVVDGAKAAHTDSVPRGGSHDGDLPQLVVLNGDVSYGMGFVSTWDSWLDVFSTPLSWAPWLTTIGNHERDWPGSGDLFGGNDSGGECGVAYMARMVMPTAEESLSKGPGAERAESAKGEQEGRGGLEGVREKKKDKDHGGASHADGAWLDEVLSAPAGDGMKRSDVAALGYGAALAATTRAAWRVGGGAGLIARHVAGDRPWFSVDFGPIHFTQISTEHDFSKGSPQYDFIQRDLAAVDRCRTPWLIVGGHRPFYIDSQDVTPISGDATVAKWLTKDLEPLLQQYMVDMTWTGHNHSYQRTCPVLGGACVGYAADGTAKGPVHVVMGFGGAGLSTEVEPKQPPMFEKVFLGYGYAIVDAWTEGDARKIRVRAVAADDGSTIDEVVLVRPMDPGCPKGAGHEQGVAEVS